MYLPASVTLSKHVSDQFQTIKKHTGVPNNVLARFAIGLALESEGRVDLLSVSANSGKTLDRDLLFGGLLEIYEVMIREYMIRNKINMPLGPAIASLVEIGAHRMGHVRSLCALTALAGDTQEAVS